MSLNIVIAGLSITSSWGNGHATTYRALAKALSELVIRSRFSSATCRGTASIVILKTRNIVGSAFIDR